MSLFYKFSTMHIYSLFKNTHPKKTRFFSRNLLAKTGCLHATSASSYVTEKGHKGKGQLCFYYPYLLENQIIPLDFKLLFLQIFAQHDTIHYKYAVIIVTQQVSRPRISYDPHHMIMSSVPHTYSLGT